MDERFLETLFGHLKSRGIALDQGLTDMEVAQIEHAYGIQFPEDLAQMLKFRLPISKPFPNWRSDSEATIRERLLWPLDGICFDIEHSDFWLETWGSKPKSLSERFETAKYHVTKAPHLIPVYAHRVIPDEPSDKGNPVYSVWQTDIIYYGYDLMDYVNREFDVPLVTEIRKQPKRIRFWDELVS